MRNSPDNLRSAASGAMQFHAVRTGETGNAVEGHLTFSNPALAAWRWPCIEIRGAAPGPRICVMGGVHVNEVSAMEAAARLGSLLPQMLTRGSVSILPVVNMPALGSYTEFNCPIDGKNINYTFPGQADGSFSEILADSILNEWAIDADLLIDLHGGDLRESVVPWAMFQLTGDAEFDQRSEALAYCFDTPFVESLDPSLMSRPGRACTARAARRRLAVMSEAGGNGLVDSASVDFHVTGVLNIASHLRMIDERAVPSRDRTVIERRLRLEVPEGGLCESRADAAQFVTEGEVVAVIRDHFWNPIAEVRTPESGLVMCRFTHSVVQKGQWIMTLGIPRHSSPPQQGLDQ